MVSLNDDIQKIERDMKFQLEDIEAKRLATIESLKKDEDALKRTIEPKRREVQEKQAILHEYTKLADDEANIKQVLDGLRKALSALDMAPSNEEQIVIGEVGYGNPAPVRPNRSQMILAGLALGLGVGLTIIYLLGRLDDRLELAEDIEAELEEPVLGQIPLVDMKDLKDDRLLITHMDEHNMFSESIRGVRSAVMLGGKPGKKQVLLITSAVPGDGKTTFTVNFAVTLAIAGHRVLLVDADLRRGNTHNYFKDPREPGFSDVLLGELHWSDVVHQTEVKTLQAIHSGKLPSNPGELLISPVTRQFIDEVRQSFDYIIFDCPPLTAIDDAFSLVGLADGLLFVVRSGQTSMRFAKTALTTVRQRGANILGIVLNGITADNPYYYYKNYYHSYYSKGQPRPVAAENLPVPAAKMAPPKVHRLKSRFHRSPGQISGKRNRLAPGKLGSPIQGGTIQSTKSGAPESNRFQRFRLAFQEATKLNGCQVGFWSPCDRFHH